MSEAAPPALLRFGAFVERALLLALCLGTGATLLFVARNGLLPRESPLTFGLAFLVRALPWYALWLVPPLAGVWALSRARGSALAPRAALGLVALTFFLATALLNHHAAHRLFALEGPARFRYLTPLAFLLACAGALAAALPSHRRWPPRLLGTGALLAAVVALLPSPPKQGGPTSGVRAPTTARPPLVFLGVDGADWKFIDPLVARGDLPTFAALRRRGVSGKLATIRPTLSPAIWTSMVTGQPPRQHGVEGFMSLRMAGVAGALGPLHQPRGIGFAQLYGALERRGTIANGPVVSGARRVPAFWEIATAHGSPVSVINMWATWPAEPVLGMMVSERLYFWRQEDRGAAPETGRLTFPEELYAEIRPLVMSPQDVTHEHSRAFMDVSPEEFESMKRVSVNRKTIGGEFKYLYSMLETERRIALHLVERGRRAGRPADLMVLFRIVDIACHRSLAASELVKDPLDATEEDRRKFGRVVSEAYRRVDRAMSDILEAFGEANVVVVSDHGFQREPFEDRRAYQHRHAPPGIFLAAGPAFREGTVDGLGIYDVMPILAHLKGFPVADDLEHGLRNEVFTEAFMSTRPVVRVATYGPRGAVVTAPGSPETDDAMLERLRALGYLQ